MVVYCDSVLQDMPTWKLIVTLFGKRASSSQMKDVQVREPWVIWPALGPPASVLIKKGRGY